MAFEISKETFEEVASTCGFDEEDIRWGTYNGRGYDRGCTGLVGSWSSALKFFARLGELTADGDEKFTLDDVHDLAERTGYDGMGYSDQIFYWTPRSLKITEE